MKKSNIFVYVELSKLIDNLTANEYLSKQNLRSQASYFQLIPSKYFSDDLFGEWESICEVVKNKGPQYDENGKIITNAVINTIDQMSQQECAAISDRIISLYEKIKREME